ncbi:hypothetical protein ACFLQZ_02865 [Acidobacteriota bacterium]
MIKNPLNDGISTSLKNLEELDFSFPNMIPSGIILVVLAIVLFILLILWPYGFFVVIEDHVRGFMRQARNDMKGKSLFAKTPFVVTLGVFFIIWIPFAIICLPFALLGAIGSIFAK